ncbi:MAG TPA: hypothetical protein PLE72_08300 [Azospira sp.]|nr:hypothetical protein [Azospira sp.]
MRVQAAWHRLPLLTAGMFALLGGTLAGLARLGWPVPTAAAAQAGNHAALMISAFFGALISLERAVALGRGWAYAGPAAAGLGGIALVAGAPLISGQALAVVGSAILVAGSGTVLRRQAAPYTLVLAGGAASWLIGNLLWLLNGHVLRALPWWLAFLVLTIAGERLELTRFLPVRPHSGGRFLIAVAPLIVGGVTALIAVEAAMRIFSLGLVLLAAWLFRYDIARHNAGQRGLTRYVAICLLTGYFWLAVGGLLGVIGGFSPGNVLRDAALHAVALGFVFAMVFGHAPIIFPSVTRVRIPYRPLFYLPLATLNIALACRIAGSLIASALHLRQHGALATALAILLFILTLAFSFWRGAGKSTLLPMDGRVP